MRRDRTFARILFIFSIANVMLAAPAVVRQRGLVTDVPDDQSTDESMPSLETASGVSKTSAGPGLALQEPPESQSGSMHVSPPGSEQDWTGSPPAGSLHQGGVEPATPPPPPAGLHQDWIASHASLSDASLSQYSASPHDADRTPGSLSPQFYDDPPSWTGSPQWSGPPELHDDSPGSGAQPDAWKHVPLRGNPPSGSGAQPLFKDPPWWQNYRPVSGTSSEIEQASSSRLPSSHLRPGEIEAQRMSGPSFGPGWVEVFAAVADAEAKKAEDLAKDKVKPPKGLCGLRCWMQFHPRSFKWSPESDHGHLFL